jgi:hypothetical protein
MTRLSNRGAEVIAVAGVGVLVLAHLTGVLQGVAVVLVCAGALAIGITAGWVYVRWVIPARRLARMGITAARGPRLTVRAPGRDVESTTRGSDPAAVEGGPHLHLHLPAGVSADELARLLRGDR